MEIKIYNRNIIIETGILFALFYLPSYLFQNVISDPSAFNDFMFNIQLWIIYLPQIALIIYIIHINTKKNYSDFGLIKLKLKHIPTIFLTTAGLVLIVGIIQLIIYLIPYSTPAENMFLWDFHNIKLIPLVFITSLLTGYSEELFFRSYLYTRLEELKLGRMHILITVNLIFALGHFYEGYEGGINAFVLGSYFSLIFIWRRNIHITAIVHGLYNFSVLMISSWLG
ncbi:MAG: CPBP family intramembrane metalloprotease [Spirochaetaceae bacterium]|nr:CPBP family intramembrane metalloprotease [Spirochaetaceae bacterium]